MMALDGTSPVAGTSTVVEVLDGRPAFLRSEGGDALAAVFAEAAADIGVPFATVATGGSSDGNFTAGQGVPTLDGLGAVGGGYHTVEEHLEVASIEVRARLCHAALIRLSQQQIR
jgi:glutamate carboxypeptidase